MEEAPRPRRDGDEGAPTDPRFGEPSDLTADEPLVVAADYPTAPVAESVRPGGSITRMMDYRRATGGIARARDYLLAWVQRDPAVALGVALGLGLVVGFVLRRSVFLGVWEVEGVKRV